MSTFLNLNIDSKIKSNFLAIHIFLSLFWILGILIFVFRIDNILVVDYKIDLSVLFLSVPVWYFILLVFFFFFVEWYYIIVFILYPLLFMFWFLPKTILSVGKIYLFGNYLNFIFSSLSNFKLSFFNILLFLVNLILLTSINENWVRILAITTFTYFYSVYLFKFLVKSFKEPTLFGNIIEEYLEKSISSRNFENSFLIKSVIVQKSDDELELAEKKKVQLERLLMANFAIDLFKKKLSGYRGRVAYIVSWLFGSIAFLIGSIVFFWFINFQLYKIDSTSFVYKGHFPVFDYLYYTLKTITYGDIDLIRPVSVLARCIETISFFTIGVFILVIVISVFLSMKQDKVNENVKLTVEYFDSENVILTNYMENELGVQLKFALKEIRNIDDSFKNLKSIIEKIL
jgi:hypothetical protein